MISYTTSGTCSKIINFEIIDGKLHNVKFVGGCSGNLQAMSRLVDGKPVDEVIATLKGIKCRSNTSCGDQLATALEIYKRKLAKTETEEK
jgi:uncharacterized protein (TIGR03905 family)